MRRRTASALPLVTASAAVAAAVVSRRRARRRAAPPRVSRLPHLPGRERTVLTEDDVELHVEEHGPQGDDAAAVVVLAHGYTQASRLWSGTVRDLLDARPDVRAVVYDHRGHGRSARATRETATLEQLGRDLHRVVRATAGDRPVVLVGHSMGGMTLMALAEEHPELVDEQVAGVAFVGTSAGGLHDVGWGLPRPLGRAFNRVLPSVNELAYRLEQRGVARRQVVWFERFVNFAAGADPSDVQDVLDVQRDCTAETVHLFLGTMSEHDREEALEALAHLPALVVVGDRDRLCPLEHSRAIAAALPRAELVVLPGAGHMVHLDRRAEVSAELVALVGRALAPARPVAQPV